MLICLWYLCCIRRTVLIWSYQKIKTKNETKIFPYILTNNSGAIRVIQILKMLDRLKRLATRPDHHQLSDVKLPRSTRRSSKHNKASSSTDTTDSKLYRLRVLEEDEENGHVKVGYIGFSDEYDEWRRLEDIVNIEEDEEEEENVYLAPSRLKFCLLEEVACWIKSLLFSSRKASPVCSVIMSFDRVHFDLLVIRGIRKETK